METTIALISVLITSAGVLVALVAILWNIKNNNKQLSTQAFISYTTKFDNLKIHEQDKWRDRKTSTFESTGHDKNLGKDLNAYLHLCCQQFYLLRKKMIKQAIWDIWEPEIEYNLKTRLVRTYWKEDGSSYFGLYPEFKAYVDCVQSNSSKGNCAKTFNK